MPDSNPIPLYLLSPQQVREQSGATATWIEVSKFTGETGTHCLVPNADGGLAKVLVGTSDNIDTWTLGNLPQVLPSGRYVLGDPFSDADATKLSLGWQLGQYKFTTYKRNSKNNGAEFIVPDNADRAYVEAATEATFLVRELIDTPANDMGPDSLEASARTLAETYHANIEVIVGETLLERQYPMVYNVGKANARPPRLLDLRWGDENAPKVTLVGKGVCFDTGGLDLKSASGMKLMKKDMGGAAQMLGLATMIMKLQLPVRLRVLVPAVENSVADNAMRPSDVLPTRKGITVEVGNTDAEGRLILSDALWEASSEDPQLIVDCATLTGAARVALGSELPALFCNRVEMATAAEQAGQATDDPVWHMPLHEPYRAMLESKIADICNISSGSYGGAITAALFLREFVKPEIPWIHVDFMGWNLRGLPGRPEGGEAMGMRALFETIRTQVVRS